MAASAAGSERQRVAEPGATPAATSDRAAGSNTPSGAAAASVSVARSMPKRRGETLAPANAGAGGGGFSGRQIMSC